MSLDTSGVKLAISETKVHIGVLDEQIKIHEEKLRALKAEREVYRGMEQDLSTAYNAKVEVKAKNFVHSHLKTQEQVRSFLSEAVEWKIKKCMNYTDALDVYDHIAYNLIKGKDWRHGMQCDKNGNFLNGMPLDIVKDCVRTRFRQSFESYFHDIFNAVIFDSDLTSSYINSELRRIVIVQDLLTQIN